MTNPNTLLARLGLLLADLPPDVADAIESVVRELVRQHGRERRKLKRTADRWERLYLEEQRDADEFLSMAEASERDCRRWEAMFRPADSKAEALGQRVATLERWLSGRVPVLEVFRVLDAMPAVGRVTVPVDGLAELIALQKGGR